MVSFVLIYAPIFKSPELGEVTVMIYLFLEFLFLFFIFNNKKIA